MDEEEFDDQLNAVRYLADTLAFIEKELEETFEEYRQRNLN